MRDNGGVDEATLDRLEPSIPETVARVRQQRGNTDHDAVQALYRGIQEAIMDGTFSMDTESTYGETYEVVNLPTRFREVELSVPGGRYHIGTIERQLNQWIDDEEMSLSELSLAIEALLEHQAAIEEYISEYEREFEDRCRTIRRNLESVRTITDHLDGQVGDRTRMLVIQNRHAEFDGVSAISSDIEDAKRALHQCAFDEATSRLGELERKADELVTTVDFFRSLVGGIEHGQSTARLPNDTAKQLYLEIEGLLEDQHDLTLALDGEQVVVTGRETSDDPTDGGRGADTERQAEGTASQHTETMDRVNPATVADEILYILREFKNGDTSGQTVEYQTERLPDAIARSDVLRALADFCRRRTSVVASVSVQEGAPPGFFEITFTDGTETVAGLDALADAFTERYGDS